MNASNSAAPLSEQLPEATLDDALRRLEDTRRGLLDLTRRNRLLNHKTTGRKTLQIVDERPAELFRLLVDQTRTMQFLAREEASEEVDWGTIDAELKSEDSGRFTVARLDSEVAKRHTDQYLQTALEGDKLQKRLIHLAREAGSALQELGTNTLFLTLGVVQWPDGAIRSRAPLVFVPVAMQRKNAATRHALSVLDEDIVVNPCLAELCRREWRFELPELDPESEDADDLDRYFARVLEALPGEDKGWTLHGEVHLGIFSFAKMLMYHDLDPASWPESHRLVDHRRVLRLLGVELPAELDQGLAGAGLPGAGLPDPATLDETTHPRDAFQVLDADSSQQAAIAGAKAGHSLVIQGPPGTGKSQTIANIIAECLAADRSVLFVSEKAAALEVVQRRLTAVGLGDFLLELHSRNAGKRAVLQELQRVMELAESPPGGREQTGDELGRLRGSLNDYRRELHRPREPLGLSVFRAMGRAVALRDAVEVPGELPGVETWTDAELQETSEALEQLERRLAAVGDESSHPWRGAGWARFGLRESQDLKLGVPALVGALRDASERAGALAAELEVEAPTTLAGLRSLTDAAETLCALPELPELDLDSPRWTRESGVIESWLADGRAYAEARAVWSEALIPEAFERDWTEILERRLAHADSFLRVFRPSWHGDSKTIGRHLRDGLTLTAESEHRVLRALVRSRRRASALSARSPAPGPLFAAEWRELDSDWARLEEIFQAVATIRSSVLRPAGPLGAATILRRRRREDRAPVSAAAAAARAAIDALDLALNDWCGRVAAVPAVWFAGDPDEMSLAALVERHEALADELERAAPMAELNRSRAELRRRGLAGFLKACREQGLTSGHARSFQRQFLRLWLDRAIGRSPVLRDFQSGDHEATVERFRGLDRAWLELSRARLARRLRGKRPNLDAAGKGSKVGILKAEMRKKSRHMPLRRLFALTGEVVKRLKPCFMMSPLSVARFLQPGGLRFDVVIFDEASQVEPAESFGAIARGEQLILVGDEKQLPPTDFFNKADTGGSEDIEGVSSRDLESVLGLGTVHLPERRQTTLRWHYRSRHRSLIEFSNEAYYDRRLRIFPSPHTDRSRLGLQFELVADGIYRRGKGQDNPVEARRVVAAVVEHARRRPQLTLGVGAFSTAQQTCIQDELERVRRESRDPALEEFLHGHEDEPFFVKNLETIQGDERDVILLSVGYGKDAEGRMHMNFGPLNRDGGHRRLNVLVSRARLRCRLFASIRAGDIDLGRTSARGVQDLKRYLEFAETGRLQSMAPPGGEHDSPLEADICQALRDAGWNVHAQVGSAGFSIDLAVVHPESPGRYLAGIECDGATWHSSPTARDRDRLRQEVLEGLGWTILRIWSTDWFQRRDATLAGVLKQLDTLAEQPLDPEPELAVRETGEAGDRDDSETSARPETDAGSQAGVEPRPERASEAASELPADPPRDVPTVTAPAEPELPAEVQPYLCHVDPKLDHLDIKHSASRAAAAGPLVELVRVEGPIPRDVVDSRMAAWFGTRLGKRVRTVIDGIIDRAIASGAIQQDRGFLQLEPATGIRRRDANDCPVTRAEHIPPAEYELAVRVALREAMGIAPDHLAGAVRDLFGFKRTGKRLQEEIDAAVQRLKARGEVVEDGQGFLVLKSA